MRFGEATQMGVAGRKEAVHGWEAWIVLDGNQQYWQCAVEAATDEMCGADG
jgi:hypothetical protein